MKQVKKSVKRMPQKTQDTNKLVVTTFNRWIDN